MARPCCPFLILQHQITIHIPTTSIIPAITIPAAKGIKEMRYSQLVTQKARTLAKQINDNTKESNFIPTTGFFTRRSLFPWLLGGEPKD